MRKAGEILRLKWHLGRTNREIGISLNVSTSTVSDCVCRARKSGLSWPLDESLDDESLEKRLYPNAQHRASKADCCIDWTHVHQQMKRKRVTLQLLWYEYKSQHPEGLGYSRYCHHYRHWRSKIDVCMRQHYKAGEKLFVDYAGMTVSITDQYTGDIRQAQIFVAALGASNYLYVDATFSQSLPDWLGSHVRAFEFFGGVPQILVPDNLKSGVKKSNYYEPDLNPSFAEMAKHYAIAVIPTRVCAPKDKAKVEQAVQHIERRLLAVLRDRKFFSLHELNEAIKPLLKSVNDAPFQKLPGSRWQQFQALEKPALQSLPAIPYQFAQWKKARLGVDYHIDVEGHYYSAPYALAKQTCDVRYTRHSLEIFCQGKRVASHRRSYHRGKHTTLDEHMPPHHFAYAKWTPARIIRWAKDSGESTAELAQVIIDSRCHPQQGFRSCMGLVRLGKRYGKERLNAACLRALHIGSFSYKSVQSILKNRLDQRPLPENETTESVTRSSHDYVRGGDYYG